jgi:hypothetical protein
VRTGTDWAEAGVGPGGRVETRNGRFINNHWLPAATRQAKLTLLWPWPSPLQRKKQNPRHNTTQLRFSAMSLQFALHRPRFALRLLFTLALSPRFIAMSRLWHCMIFIAYIFQRVTGWPLSFLSFPICHWIGLDWTNYAMQLVQCSFLLYFLFGQRGKGRITKGEGICCIRYRRYSRIMLIFNGIIS